MNLFVFVSFLLSLESLIYETLYGGRWRVIFYSVATIMVMIPFFVSILEFFTSVKSKKQRILYSIYSMIYTDEVEKIISEKSLEKGFIYCNEFYSNSVDCPHGRSFMLCSNNDPGRVLILGRSDDDISLGVTFVDYLSLDERGFLIKLGLKEAGFDISPEKRLMWEGLTINKIDSLIKVFGWRNDLCIVSNLKIKKLSLTFNYYQKKGFVNYIKSSALHSLTFVERYECEHLEDYKYLIRLITDIKKSGRDCCFIIDDSLNVVRGGCLRVHSLPVNFVVKEILKGKKVKYSEPTECYKCVGSMESKLLSVKFGNRSIYIEKFIKLCFPDPEINLPIISYVIKCESGLKPKSIEAKNWQWKRFVTDLSYLRSKIGLVKMHYIDPKIRPTKRVNSFLKEVDLIEVSKLPLDDNIVQSYKLDFKKVIKHASVSNGLSEQEFLVDLNKKTSESFKNSSIDSNFKNDLILIKRMVSSQLNISKKKGILSEIKIKDLRAKDYLQIEELDKFIKKEKINSKKMGDRSSITKTELKIIEDKISNPWSNTSTLIEIMENLGKSVETTTEDILKNKSKIKIGNCVCKIKNEILESGFNYNEWVEIKNSIKKKKGKNIKVNRDFLKKNMKPFAKSSKPSIYGFSKVVYSIIGDKEYDQIDISPSNASLKINKGISKILSREISLQEKKKKYYEKVSRFNQLKKVKEEEDLKNKEKFQKKLYDKIAAKDEVISDKILKTKFEYTSGTSSLSDRLGPEIEINQEVEASPENDIERLDEIRMLKTRCSNFIKLLRRDDTSIQSKREISSDLRAANKRISIIEKQIEKEKTANRLKKKEMDYIKHVNMMLDSGFFD